MGDSKKSKRGEAREFWEAAIRLWSESGLSVREFCRREGLAEHTFFSWRRELRADSAASKDGQAASDESRRVAGAGRRRRQGKKVAGVKPKEGADKTEENVAAGFIELVPPASAGVCCCTLELENEGGAKMRVKLRGFTVTDVAAIGRSFWDPAS